MNTSTHHFNHAFYIAKRSNKSVNVFKNGPSKIFRRLPSTNFTWSILEYLDPNDIWSIVNKINEIVIILFLPNISILYPLETPETQKFSKVLRGYKMETQDRNRVTLYKISFPISVYSNVAFIFQCNYMWCFARFGNI